MAKFPEYTTLGWANPLVIVLNFRSLVTQFEDLGEEKRKLKQAYVTRDVTLSYKVLSRAEAKTIWDFYIARQGIYNNFSFFLNYSDTYTQEYVGSGNASKVIYDLPAKTSSVYTVYLDGVGQTDPADYSFSAGTGTDGADEITFVAAPGRGVRITYSFTGILKVRSRFMEDSLSFEQIYNKLVSTGMVLKGLLNTSTLTYITTTTSTTTTTTSSSTTSSSTASTVSTTSSTSSTASSTSTTSTMSTTSSTSTTVTV